MNWPRDLQKQLDFKYFDSAYTRNGAGMRALQRNFLAPWSVCHFPSSHTNRTEIS